MGRRRCKSQNRILQKAEEEKRDYFRKTVAKLIEERSLAEEEERKKTKTKKQEEEEKEDENYEEANNYEKGSSTQNRDNEEPEMKGEGAPNPTLLTPRSTI